MASYQGRGVEADVELALDGDGTMLALRARICADLGGYLMPTTAIPGHTTAMLMCGVYDIQAADVRSWACARTRCRPARTAAPGGPRRRTSWSARWTSPRGSSGSTRSSCAAAT